MVDRKKVIKGLRHCTALAGLHECQPKVGPDCPYEDKADCKLALMRDALALLKEQEPVVPYVDGEGNYCCKACDTVVGWKELTDAGLTPYVYKFCPECGKAVLWEGR
ncbi:MAG: hypothetical protein IKE08_04135 [Clostridia bacterium]|nr:hypothetical protein [Clostridia bacterium]